ncbi:AMP-binding protein [Streptomyces marispadix]|uniref:AMP-binding protein n=1 Tax=Streptomyces marispadix TaxID=2922868 RepID=A0ABS9SSW5_9ACTN|nr:AMP-binding protein [Streptomyces marispadix]MCH6159356.1 AMP-binding protein [Streptomyces marispadix]
MSEPVHGPGAAAPRLPPGAPLCRVPFLAAEFHGAVRFGCDVRWRAGRSLVDSVAGFADAVARHARRLRAAGVRPGSVVAVIRRNHADLQALLYAALHVGAVPALLPLRLGRDRLLDCLGALDRPHLLLDVAGVVRLDGAEEAVRSRCGRVFTLSVVDESTHWWAPPLPHGGDEAPHGGGGAPHGSTPEDPGSGPGAEPVSGPRLSGRRTGSGPCPDSGPGPGPDEVVTYDLRDGRLRALSGGELRARADQSTSGRPARGPGADAAHFDFCSPDACATVLGALVHEVPFLALTRTESPTLEAFLRDHRPVSLEAPAEVLADWAPLAAAPTMPFSSVRRFVASDGPLDRRTVRTLLDASAAPRPFFVQRGAAEAPAVR